MLQQAERKWLRASPEAAPRALIDHPADMSYFRVALCSHVHSTHIHSQEYLSIIWLSAGSLYFICYLLWGAICISTPNHLRNYRHHRALWISVAVLCTATLLTQLAVQALYILSLLPTGDPDDPSGSSSTNSRSVAVLLLQAFGFSCLQDATAGQLTQLLLPPVILLIVAAAEVSEAASAVSHLQDYLRRQGAAAEAAATAGAARWGTGGGATAVQGSDAPMQQSGAAAAAGGGGGGERAVAAQQTTLPQPATAAAASLSFTEPSNSQNTCTDASLPLSAGLKYSNAGILLAALLLPSSCLSPSVLCLPYLSILFWGVWCWARGRVTWTTTGRLLLLQSYCGLHLLLLYVVQLVLLLQLLPEDAKGWLRMLGVYAAGLEAEGRFSGVTQVQLAHFVVLHLLYAAIGLNVALSRQLLYKHLRGLSQGPTGRELLEKGMGGGLHERRRRAGSTARAVDLQDPLLGGDAGRDSTVIQVGTSAGRMVHASTRGYEAPGLSSTAVPEDLEIVMEPGSSAFSTIIDSQELVRPVSPSLGLASMSPTWRPPSLLRWNSIRDWEPLQRFVAEGSLDGEVGAAGVQYGAPLGGGRVSGGSPGGMATATSGQNGGHFGSGEGVGGGGWPAWSQLRLLLHVLLPLLVHGGEVVLGSLAAVPAMGAIAMAGFAMVQVRWHGWWSQLHVYALCSVCAMLVCQQPRL